MRVRYLAIAQEEIREAADYYAAISPELGKAFRLELRQLMRLVATMPQAWPKSGGTARKCLLTRFPYLVIYVPLPDELLVLAVGHQHRQPGYWRDRLK
jgi:plasmid stabilization system protein ParE